MAWNRPSENGEAVSRPLHKKSSLKRSGDRFSVKGAVTGAIIVLGAAVAAWWLWPNASAPVAEVGDGTVERRIREVTPAAAPRYKKDAEVAKAPDAKPYWKLPTTNGLNEAQQRKWWAMNQPPAGYTNDTSRYEVRPNYAIFESRVDNEIACYLSIKPGQSMVGTPDYGPEYTRTFLKSIESPIIVKEDDDDATKALKRAVIEVKADLKARLDAGEELGDIMRETRREYQRLNAYKRDISAEINELVGRDDISDEDVEDFVKAANVMLEQKGIAPLEIGPITKGMIRYSKGHLE